MERYTVERVLSKALFGDVVLARDRQTGEQVAIKRMQQEYAKARTVLHEARQVSEDIEFEKHVNQVLQKHGGHANVLAMREDFVEDDQEHFVFDYCAMGELYQVTEALDNQRLDAATAKRYFIQIARGLQYIHACGFGHRDLSLENVLLDDNGVCRVCDFGLAAHLDTKQTQTVGKGFYMAPEVVSGHPYDPAKADVWSLGIVLFILLSGAPLVEFADMRDSRFQYLECDGLQSLIESWNMLDLFDSQCLCLLDQMLCVDPDFRLSLSDVLDHPYVTGREATIADITCELGSLDLLNSNIKMQHFMHQSVSVPEIAT